MRLFRAVRAVGLSLVLVCGVRPSMRRLRAVWRYACVVRARARFLGGAVRWFAGCAPVTLRQCFPTPTLSPPRVLAGVLYWKRSHTG